MIKLRKKQKGFTLVELLIVIAIIAVLAAVVTPVALGAIADSRATAVYAEIRSIQTADLTYFVQNESYGTIDQLELAGLSTTASGTNSSGNAKYSISGTDTRTLVVTIDNGATAAKIAEKANKTLSGTELMIDDKFIVNFIN